MAGTLLELRSAKEKAALKAGRTWKRDALVFPTETSKPQDRRNVRRVFRRVLRRAGLGEWVKSEGRRGPRKKFIPGFRLYDLRHSTATLLLAGGTDPRTVSEWLGHASASFILDVYGHALPETKQHAVDRLTEVFSEG